MTELKINKMPSATWSWLKMNSAAVTLEDSYFSEMKNVSPSVRGLSDSVKYSEDSVFTSDLTGGAGKGADVLYSSAKPVAVTFGKKSKTEKPVVLEYDLTSDSNALTSQIICAEEDAEATVIIVCSSDKKLGGLNALKTQIVAKNNSKLHVIKVQLLGEKFIQIDETESVCAENAQIEVSHVVLGGAKTYVGVGNDLAEYKASFKSHLSYYCKDEQELDLNYVVLHHGKKTECNMDVNGTLKGNSKKTYRGTIDFKNGCAGSVGKEQEQTLLLSDNAVNNSIPIILCDEEDVSGEHGASIGRLGEDVLFYMENRGIEKSAAENLIARAKVQSTVSLINDEDVLSKTELFMDSIFGEL